MTEIEKDRIQRMRWRGFACADIARALGLPEGTVKTYCARNALQDSDLQGLYETQRDFAISAVCRQCGAMLVQHDKRKTKHFCSDACRLSWWNAHRDEVSMINAHVFICAACGKEFSSYDPNRRFCSTPCYIQSRFGGGRHDARTIQA